VTPGEQAPENNQSGRSTGWWVGHWALPNLRQAADIFRFANAVVEHSPPIAEGSESAHRAIPGKCLDAPDRRHGLDIPDRR
jgi:hypothetical protein